MHRTETGPPAHRGWPGFTIRVCPVAGGPFWCDDSTVRVTAVNVDDHAGLRAMARGRSEGPDVVGEAVGGAGGMSLVVGLRPGVVGVLAATA